MQVKIYTIILISFLFCCSQLRAQQTGGPVISGDFKGLTIDTFLITIEKQSGYKFYYDTAWFDSTRISLSVKNEPLQAVLTAAFKDIGLVYTIDHDKNVFVSKGITVQTDLPESFFAVVTNPQDSSAQTSAKDIEEPEEKVQVAKQDNKLYVIGQKNVNTGEERVTVTGYIRDAKSGEPVIGASVYIQNPTIGVSTDQYGYFTIQLPKGKHTLFVQSIGMTDTKRQLLVQGEGKINIDMAGTVMTLKRVIVSAEKASNIRSLQMGSQKIDIKTIKQVPVVFGEADVLRVALTMPGVKSVGEASTGLNVRGGSADQNLILFNDATIYNPAHFFGMFSAFNPEVVKDVELFKSSIPARYGGRLSSVVNINSREGNKKNITGSAGIGLLTSRINIEGPLVKDKSSFILGGRTTYANWLLKLLPSAYENSKASFYDLNLNITHEINKKNYIYLTGYMSSDRFNLNSDTFYTYGNKNVSLKWKHIFSNKVYSLVTAGYDNYAYKISSEKNPVNAYSLGFDINQAYFKAHVNYFINSKHTVEFGINSLFYKLHSGTYQPIGKESLVVPVEMQAEQALESALYFSDKYNINNKLSIESGIRYSVYNFFGPYTVNNYPDGVPKTEDNIIGTTTYDKGKIVKTYHGPELRIGARYILNQTLSIKAGYNSQRQYIHMLSNTAAMAPTDIWKLSDPNIKPQYGDQVSVGIYKNLKNNTIEISGEIYYKRIKDYLDYKSGAVLVLNPHIETDVLKTKGKAYGAELLIKKLTGKFNGWVSYTYSRILLTADNPETGDFINNGDPYPANYDKPHDVTFIGNYRFSHRFSISLNATYSTGRPITLPIGRFYYADGERTLYANRNGHRIPDYFRTDFSMNIEGNHKVHQKTHNSWTVGVYNLTGRKNPYSVYYVSENGAVNGYKLSIFGSAIPYVNFNIRF
ncbi:TonB-dependent receptor [Panacibacter sp. DH6]|uniref:TonB-dependent receptor n=1 Tax=Panacibacter microcysteis TaxID=2793269 RepID=A0A931E7Q9_9BACT|nr:TonB-dependent receptor [Panacibacter microcysteis]MBG9377747.1 TonB-dependent receptor [Panacibacter microcysteis]